MRRMRINGWIGGGMTAALLALLPVAAPAQVFYSAPGARPVSDDSPALGLAVGFGDDLFRLVWFGRFNASRASDLGLEIVYEDLDTGAGSDDQHRFGGGADYRHRVVEQNADTPVDVAVQFGAGLLAHDDYTLIKVPLGAMVSRTFAVEETRDVVPYGGVYLIMDFLDSDTPGNDGFDSDLDVEFRVGASVDIVERTAFFAALHAGNGTMFFLGLNASL